MGSPISARLSALATDLGALLDDLGMSPHPQEFGMDGCPLCFAADRIKEAMQEVESAEHRLLQQQEASRV